MSKFQIITLAIFILAIIGGVIAFATFKGGSSGTTLPTITIWGTFPADVCNKYVANVNATLPQALKVSYVEESPDSFSQDFVAALARGTGPDGILIPTDMILPHEDKLTLIPYGALSERSFMDSFIQEGQIYLSQNGILAIPFTVDPLVMYWNRDLFSAAGLTTYPKNWGDFTTLGQALTQKDQNGTVRKSAVAMGQFSNITNARELFGTLLLQSGNPVTTLSGSVPATTLATGQAISQSVLQFFGQFANPSSPVYSWNRAMPNDKTAFLSGTLATYFGFASELGDIRNKNPNLNFDVAPLPQYKTGKTTEYAKMFGFSIVRTSANANAVYQIVSILTSPTNLAGLSQTMYLPTVLNSLDQSSTDPYITNFNKAALTASTWIDADPVKSRQIFSAMVDAFSSGQKTAYQAVQDAANQYDVILRQAVQ